MKVLHLSTQDVAGGAARAMYRLHQCLQGIGLSSSVLVQDKDSEDPTVIAPEGKIAKGLSKIKPTLDGLPLLIYTDRNHAAFSPSWIPNSLNSAVSRLGPDIVNLHWVGNGLINVGTVAKLKKKLVWTLHDMWAFTGGCHYSQECDRYTDSCGACPELHSSRHWDLSRLIWRRKNSAWKDTHLTVVAPSSWMAKCAGSSSLFKDSRVEVIPYGLDTRVFKPIDRRLARSLLNLPQDKRLVLFGAIAAASDSRKGLHFLQPALQMMSAGDEWRDKIELVIFGSCRPSHQPDLGFKSRYLGKLSDDLSLVLAYAAADVFVAPSVQDNLPNTVLEAIACGTPCVAFNIGGMPDMIEHQRNGYLARPFEVEDLSRGISWVLEDDDRHQKLCARAREKAEREFTYELQAHRYEALYTELIESH